MFFKTYKSQTVVHAFFKSYFYGSLLLAMVAMYGFGSRTNIFSTFTGCLFIVVVSVLSLNKRFQASPFSILLCLFTFLYLMIPTAFVLIKGNSYVFGSGLISVPFEQKDYTESLPFGFLYLLVLWFAVWLGIILSRPNKFTVDQKIFFKIQLKHILLLGCIVFVVTWIDNKRFSDVFVGEGEKLTSLVAFIFFDRAYLVLAGLVLFFKLNEVRFLVKPGQITFLISLIFLSFSLLHIVAGSKAAIMVVFTLFMLYPVSFLREYPHAKIQFPTPQFLIIIGVISGPLFFFILIQRINLGLGIAPDSDTLLAGIAETNANVVHDIIDQIFYRLSWGGLDRFLLIVQSFTIATPDPNTSTEFVMYLAKNTVNLLLPGTPFQEAYAPSSQLFSQVIEHRPMNGDVGKSELLMSLNTQPYTLFGVFIIIFGWAAPILLFFSVLAFVATYNKIRNIQIKTSMLYFFSAILSSYGFEACIGGAVNFYVSLLLMCLILRIMLWFNQNLSTVLRIVHT